MDPKADSTLVAPTDGAAYGVPDPFLGYPFAYESCTTECAPTAAEQAAYTTFCNESKSVERFWDRAPMADWMLDVLGKYWDAPPATLERELRHFALRCVEGLQGAASARGQGLLDAVSRRVSGVATLDWPEDRVEPWRESWRTAFFAKAHPEVEAAALADARRRQADLLRAILPKPFGAPVRGEVYFGEAADAEVVSVYCVTCGSQRHDATPGVLFDVRGVLCKSCGAPVARCVH